MTTKKYIVVNPHESEFPNPITFKKVILLSLEKNMQVLKAGISGFFALRWGKMLVGFLVK
ncbi:hypothetical protein [Shewanella sp. SM74]|uniref:hypothetical protein n=1 Tax=Shewanella sp. SM74 TaxID=2912807 RepID=UPI0021D9F8E4|nr:hypothetical protein [Shewanella sp. SM74]MCU8010634.1 hypothetical protein [Shewanella sp. SM74]